MGLANGERNENKGGRANERIKNEDLVRKNSNEKRSKEKIESTFDIFLL